MKAYFILTLYGETPTVQKEEYILDTHTIKINQNTLRQIRSYKTASVWSAQQEDREQQFSVSLYTADIL